MQVKGNLVKQVVNFMDENYPEKKQEWINLLSAESKNIISYPTITTKWYPLLEGVIIPTRKIAELFFDGDEKKVAYEIGCLAAEKQLSGIYKTFIREPSPTFILERSNNIMTTYYSDVNTKIIASEENMAKFKIIGFKKEHIQMCYRITGWIDKALKMVGAEKVKTSHEFEEKGTKNVDIWILVTW